LISSLTHRYLASTLPLNEYARVASRDDTVKVSAKAEYACLALIALAQRQAQDRPVHVSEIAEANQIPHSTLSQVMLKLKGAGMVRSVRGSEGGYWLARPPEEIRLGQVLRVIDGPNGVSRELPGDSARILELVWRQIRDLETEVLARTSIAELAGQASAVVATEEPIGSEPTSPSGSTR
jgi:Rrf2 family cysteine metabolism transcriptional repressor